MKKCFKCGKTKDLLDFYKHSDMKDGHLNKCKECAKKDVRKHRDENIDKIRAYDRKRGGTKKRIEANTKRMKLYRHNNPEKYRAHKVLNNAVKYGKIKKKPCAVCGTTKRIEAHHYDYSKPLDVIWLCSIHHSAVHYQKQENSKHKDDKEARALLIACGERTSFECGGENEICNLL